MELLLSSTVAVRVRGVLPPARITKSAKKGYEFMFVADGFHIADGACALKAPEVLYLGTIISNLFLTYEG